MDLNQFITGKFSAVNQKSITLFEKGRKIMKARIFFVAVLIAVFCTVSLSYADVPQMINYQGYLTDNTGAPIDGVVDITFRIYDDPTAGNLLWDEVHASVSVEDGIFNVLLGGSLSNPDPLNPGDFNGDIRYLEMQVAPGLPMTPRKEMVSVPYAFRAQTADQVINGDSDWDYWTNPGHMFSIPTGNIGIGTATPEAPLHVENLTLAAEETAVQVDFNSAVVQATARGIVAESDATSIKGARIGVYGKSTVGYSGNAGSAYGSLGYVWGYDYHGAIFGVSGASQPSSFDNWDGNATSYAAGGRFRVEPPAGISLNGTGTYYVGGVHATLDGEVNAAGDNAIVAGVIGEDHSTGTATSYAGHFTSNRTDSYDNTAVYGRCYPATGWGVGGDFSGGYVGVKGSSDHIGVNGYVANGPAGADCYGGYFQANGQSVTSIPYGVYGMANGTTGSTCYGVYGGASGSGPNIWAGYFNGRVYAQGDVGIGTTTPQANLDINGTTYFGGVATIGTGQRIQSESAGGARILGEQGNTPEKPAIGFFSTNGVDDGAGGLGIYRPLANEMAFATQSEERMRLVGSRLGIGTTNPQRALHISDVMRLEPRAAAPASPSEGDIYVNSTDHHIYCYLNGVWKQLDN